MAKVMITGGTGFIGSYVTKKLLAKRHDVVIFDSFVQYLSPLSSNYQIYLAERFRDIINDIVIKRGDTRDKDNLRRCIQEHRPEIVIHLANMPLADLSDAHSEEALSSIIQGTVNILEIMRDCDFIQRIVYASSSMIYGDFQYTPCDEVHPKAPKDVYGGTKLAAEIILQSYSRRFDLEYTIIRPSAVYGPTDVNRRVSQIFVENALLGKQLILHSGGDTELDFTHVSDTAEGISLAAFEPKARNEIFNVTRGEARSLKEFAQILKKLLPGVKTIEKPPDVFRPKRGALDISKARSYLGYEPKFSLEDGVKAYVEFVREKLINKEEFE